MENREALSMRRAVLIISTASAFFPAFMASAVNLAMPAISAEFSLDAVSLSWIATAYLLAAAIFMVPFGRIADIHGRKRIFTLGIIIYTAATLGCAFANSFTMLLAMRLVQGTGAAMLFATMVAVLTSIYPPGDRGKVLGINVAAVYLGLSLGPVIGGVLTEHLGWRSIFFVTVPPCAIMIATIFAKLKGEWAEARGEKLDIFGSLLYAAAIIALIYGISLLPSTAALWLVGGGIVGMVGFVRWEMSASSPVMNISLFRKNPVFSLSNLAALINYSATFSVSFLLSLYLQYIRALTPEAAGLILLSMPGMQALFSPLAGRLSDRLEPRVVASAGMALTTAALVMLIFLGVETSTGYILASLLMLGFGFALFSSPNTNAIMSAVDKRFYGVASGILGTMRLMGQMLSMGIATVLFAVYLGRAEIAPANYPAFLQSIQAAFIISAVLCFIGIFASLARGKMHVPNTPNH